MKTTMDLCKEAGYPLMSFEGVTYVSPELERLVALVRADERAATVTKDKALKLALEGAANYIDALGGDSRKYRQALAAHVQEPVKDNSNYRLDPPGLDPAGGTQVSKVWWDDDKLIAKPIPFVEFYKAAPDLQAEIDATNRQVEILSDALAESRREVAALKAVQEPIGYLFQHEETGLTTVVDVQQVEWGFEKNNPRHQKIGPVYTTPPAAQRQWVGLTLADREKLRDQFEGWNYPAILVDAVADILKEKNT